MADYISREAVINITAETGAWETQNRIRELPSADVQTIRRGRWITITNERGSDTICSRCYKTMVVMRTDFCPTCGADMRGEENG